jgi:hypothetical protein
MRCKVIQRRPGKEHFQCVATCASTEDAILFGAALIRQKPNRGPVQVWGTHKGQQTLCYLAAGGGESGPYDEAGIAKALATWRDQEKKWAQDQKAAKKVEAARAGLFHRLYTWERWDELRQDAAFMAAFQAVRVEEAEARAAELGIFPRETALATAGGVA